MTETNLTGNLDDQVATKPGENQVTIPKLPNALTVMVKVLCQEIVHQFKVFTDDGSWRDGYVPETSVLIMSSTSVLGEVRTCYDYEYDCENKVRILKLALHLSIRSDLCGRRTKWKEIRYKEWQACRWKKTWLVRPWYNGIQYKAYL